jgi:hypothetical protein
MIIMVAAVKYARVSTSKPTLSLVFAGAYSELSLGWHLPKLGTKLIW